MLCCSCSVTIHWTARCLFLVSIYFHISEKLTHTSQGETCHPHHLFPESENAIVLLFFFLSAHFICGALIRILLVLCSSAKRCMSPCPPWLPDSQKVILPAKRRAKLMSVTGSLLCRWFFCVLASYRPDRYCLLWKLFSQGLKQQLSSYDLRSPLLWKMLITGQCRLFYFIIHYTYTNTSDAVSDF